MNISATSLPGEQFRERALAKLSGAEVETRYSETTSIAEAGLMLRFCTERFLVELFKPDPTDLLQAADLIENWMARANVNAVQTQSGEENA